MATRPQRLSRTHIAIFAIGSAVFLALGFWDAHTQRQTQGQIAQAAYDYGRLVGRTQGMCFSLEGTAKANPDSVWAHKPDIVSALADCARLDQLHQPGTSELIRFGKERGHG